MQKKSGFLTACLCFSLLLVSHTAFSAEQLLVYAAASTHNAVSDIIKQFNNEQYQITVKASFASTSILAKQIEAGAPANIFLSANPKWMDYLQSQKLIIPESRFNLLQNTIVLITPSEKKFAVKMNKRFEIAKQFNGKLCLGDPTHVPAGIYAKQALTYLGWWDQLKTKIVGTKDVSAALVLTERGECAAGIVYATDASVSKKVSIITEFPAKSHEPILYPVARVAPDSASAKQFMTYLKSPAAKGIFKSYGFAIAK